MAVENIVDSMVHDFQIEDLSLPFFRLKSYEFD
jgi:hypothetical protein